MANPLKKHTATNDSRNVGVKVNRSRSMASGKSGGGDGRVLGTGQPRSLGGKGLKTGHTKTNT